MKGELFAAIVENVSTRKDRTIKITIGTNEISPAKAGQLITYSNQLVSVYISPSEIDTKEIDQVDKIDPELNNKSHSQRLRSVLYLNFTNDSKGFKTFDEYYKSLMEQIIDHYKNKLP